eukprot:12383110-Ditylum_brightwellii.AAC.1
MMWWLTRFKLLVNEIVDGAFFDFTMELWNPPINQVSININKVKEVPGTTQAWEEKVKKITSDIFPSLA